MSTPRRIRLRRTKGWKMPTGAVKVDRTTPYGNPYKPGLNYAFHPDATFGVKTDREPGTYDGTEPVEVRTCPDVATSVEWFRPWAEAAADMWPDRIEKLRGRDLACWCRLIDDDGAPVPCHADVWLEIANRPKEND